MIIPWNSRRVHTLAASLWLVKVRCLSVCLIKTEHLSLSASSPQLTVAVKSLRSSMSRQADTLKDFLQEVTVMQSLDHPNIIRLYGVVLTQPLKMVN